MRVNTLTFPIETESEDQWPGELRLEATSGGLLLSYFPNPKRAEWDQVAVALDFWDGELRALLYRRDTEEPEIIPLLKLKDAHRGEEEIKRLEAEASQETPL